MNDSIEECLLNFVQFFDENKYSFEVTEETAVITVCPGTLNIKDFQINIKIKEMNNDERYVLVYVEIKKIIEENKASKEKISEIESKNEELNKANELFKKKLKNQNKKIWNWKKNSKKLKNIASKY